MENTVYLIDYENVSYKGLHGISEVKPEDEIIIFYSNDISIIQDIISVYKKLNISIKYFQLDKTGKNALDFMVSAYAGYAASKDNVRKIAILSNDKGYVSIENIIQSVNPTISLIFEENIYKVIHADYISSKVDSPVNSGAKIELSITSGKEKTELNTFIQQGLKKMGYTSDIVNKVCKIIISHCQEDRMLNYVHNDLHTNEFDDYTKIYKDVKLLLEQYSKHDECPEVMYEALQCDDYINSKEILNQSVDAQSGKFNIEYVNLYLGNHTTINVKYIPVISYSISTCLNNNGTVEWLTEKISVSLGKKEENKKYLTEALACYKQLNYIKNRLLVEKNEPEEQVGDEITEKKNETIDDKLQAVLFDEINNQHLFGIIPIIKTYYGLDNGIELIEKKIKSNYSNPEVIIKKIKSVL